MVAVVSLLVVLALSLLVVRVGAVALVMTGLSEDVAQFQALSAFSGTGFTTSEAESVLIHPARRRVISLLIRLGSAGIVTGVSTLLLSFLGAGQAAPQRLLVLLVGVAALVALARSRTFNRALTPLIERALARYATLDLRDYADLLHLHDDYRIVEIDIEPESWLASRRLEHLDLPAEGVRVLGVVRSDGGYVGAPPPELSLSPGDRLIVYGRDHRLQELSSRRSPDQDAHLAARAEHERDVEAQQERMGGAMTL
jgi:hypothetical protein